jgi:hypothetical protein
MPRYETPEQARRQAAVAALIGQVFGVQLVRLSDRFLHFDELWMKIGSPHHEVVGASETKTHDHPIGHYRHVWVSMNKGVGLGTIEWLYDLPAWFFSVHPDGVFGRRVSHLGLKHVPIRVDGRNDRPTDPNAKEPLQKIETCRLHFICQPIGVYE